MANHLNSDQQLDQAVKEALESYEVPFESSAWAEMEKTLDAAPKTYHPFKKWSFSLNTIIAVAAVGAGLLIFKYSTSEADTGKDDTAVNTKQEQQINETPVVKTTTAVNPAPVTPAPVTDTNTGEDAAVQQPVTAVNTQPVNNYSNTSQTAYQYQWPKKKKETQASTEQTATPEQGDFDFMQMTNQQNTVPAFGDQIDPVRGFVHGTSESDKMKKLAESKLFGQSNAVPADTTSSSKFSGSDSKSSDKNGDDMNRKKKSSRKPKKEPKKDSVSETDTQASTTSSNDELAEKSSSDTTKSKKPKTGTPRYKSEKTIIDP